MSAPAGEEDAGDDHDVEEPTRNPLAWLMSRMSFLARHLIVNRPAPNSYQAQVRLMRCHFAVSTDYCKPGAMVRPDYVNLAFLCRYH